MYLWPLHNVAELVSRLDRGAELPTMEQRRRERAWQLAIALGGSSSGVTLSYAIRGGADGREASPAPALLGVLRDATGDTNKNYDDLRAMFGDITAKRPNS